ncbi:hypothetical protein V8F33_009468 [Rhypophila sp. PSN 637]
MFLIVVAEGTALQLIRATVVATSADRNGKGDWLGRVLFLGTVVIWFISQLDGDVDVCNAIVSYKASLRILITENSVSIMQCYRPFCVVGFIPIILAMVVLAINATSTSTRNENLILSLAKNNWVRLCSSDMVTVYYRLVGAEPISALKYFQRTGGA